MLPSAEQSAAIFAIRSSYNNKQSTTPFSLRINGQDLSSFRASDYQAFFLNRFEHMDTISLQKVLSHLPLPHPDIDQFICDNWNFIKDYVNFQLDTHFHEPYEISVGDRTDGYAITIKNKLTSLSRNKELRNFFNEAIINLIQLLIWFSSIQLMFDNNKKRLIVLDDFITSLDAANRTYLIMYLINTFTKEQLVILTHDFSFFNITSYVITQIKRIDFNWSFYKLYLFADEHRIENIHKINIKQLKEEFNSSTCDLNILGNKIRKCFEEKLHELSSQLTVGHLTETCEIINRISQSKNVYWNPHKTLHDLISDIESIITATPETQTKEKIAKKISDYKLTNANVLQDTINKLKLYQKVSMHPLSHGVLGLPHFQQKDVEQSLILLEKLDSCIRSMIDGKI